MLDITKVTATYRQMTEAVRNLRPCFICESKRSQKCKTCTPQFIVDGILSLLSYGNKKAKEEGIYLPTKNHKNLIISSDDDFDLEEILKNYK